MSKSKERILWSAQDLCDLEVPSDLPLIDGLVNMGDIFMFGGVSGIGKSFVSLDLAEKLCTATPLWSVYNIPKARKVLYLEQENGLWSMAQRLKARYPKDSGLRPPSDLSIVSRQWDLQLDNPVGMKQLVGWMLDTSADVLIVDPVTAAMGGDESNESIKRLFAHLWGMQDIVARARGGDAGLPPTIFLVHHFRQPPNGGQESRDYDDLDGYNFRGGSKWRDCVQGSMTMKRMQGKGDELWRLQTRVTKTRDHPEQEDPLLAIMPSWQVVNVQVKRSSMLRGRRL